MWDKNDQQLQFKEISLAKISTIESFESNDLHAKSRQEGEAHTVITVTLNSVLREHQPPTQIDYMSVDTEGSELKILSAFDFNQYKVITVEHNFTAYRAAIHSPLSSKGFTRKFEALSDWYVASNLGLRMEGVPTVLDGQ